MQAISRHWILAGFLELLAWESLQQCDCEVARWIWKLRRQFLCPLINNVRDALYRRDLFFNEVVVRTIISNSSDFKGNWDISREPLYVQQGSFNVLWLRKAIMCGKLRWLACIIDCLCWKFFDVAEFSENGENGASLRLVHAVLRYKHCKPISASKNFGSFYTPIWTHLNLHNPYSPPWNHWTFLNGPD